jgi:hypothetical protein
MNSTTPPSPAAPTIEFPLQSLTDLATIISVSASLGFDPITWLLLPISRHRPGNRRPHLNGLRRMSPSSHRPGNRRPHLHGLRRMPPSSRRPGNRRPNRHGLRRMPPSARHPGNRDYCSHMNSTVPPPPASPTIEFPHRSSNHNTDRLFPKPEGKDFQPPPKMHRFHTGHY